ncbi:MAG: dihydrofolate reductase [Polyangiaceae bacterium]|nr:dihydrofolate reductase [Polyangiaceae bacterium]
MIAAVAQNGVIGRDNALPFRLKKDMRFFQQMTLGKPVIMGRRNYDAMGRALPKRRNIVVTRQTALQIPGVEVVHSVEEALSLLPAEDEPFIIGGAEIYRLALPLSQVFYRTRILAEIDGDIFFPSFDEKAWRATELHRFSQDEENEYPVIIEKLERVEASTAL